MRYFILVSLCIAITMVAATFIPPEPTEVYRTVGGKMFTLPLVFPIRKMFEAVASCPREDLMRELVGLPYQPVTDPENTDNVYAVLLIGDYVHQLEAGGPTFPGPSFYEVTWAVMVDSPDYAWYPCGETPTSYCPFMYKNDGYRTHNFTFSTPTTPSGEEIYVEALGLNKWTEGVIQWTGPEEAPHIVIRTRFGRKDVEIQYNTTGWPRDGPQSGSFYQFNQEPTKGTLKATFDTDAQVTYVPTEEDTFWVRPHTVFDNFRHCKMQLIWHQTPNEPDYVYYHPSDKVAHMSQCGQACKVDMQCPSSCGTCVSGTCAAPVAFSHVAHAPGECSQNMYAEIVAARNKMHQ